MAGMPAASMPAAMPTTATTFANLPHTHTPAPHLLPVWISGLDHNLLLIALFAAAGSQMLNNIIGADISGTEYTAKITKIRGGVVAAIIATLVIFVIILLAYSARSWLHIAADDAEQTLFSLDEWALARLG